MVFIHIKHLWYGRSHMKKLGKTSRRNFLGSTAAGLGVASTTSSFAFAGNSHKRELTGKTAFVTGGARGIGFACAESLAKRGANIVLFDIASQIQGVPYPLASEEDMTLAQEHIESLGVGCLAIQGDVRSLEAQTNAINQAVATYGSLDFVVANAGITQVGLLESFSDDEISLVVDINLKGIMKTVQAATPILREQNSGRMVLMASVTGRMGVPTFPVYSATKWGVIGLTKSTALALGPNNVTCNAVCPTIVRTGLLDNDYILSAIAPGASFEDVFTQEASGHVLPEPFYEADVVGESVAFLCSDGAAMISGEVIDIGAGNNARFPA